jgi:hypothetical protein
MDFQEFPPLTERFPDAAISPSGTFQIKPGSPKATRLSIGCETLDRDYWEFDKGIEALR